MAILAECDICGNQHRVKDGLVGNSIRCKECGVQFVVPANHAITPDAFFEAGGRLHRREAVHATGFLPRFVAGLAVSLVVAALFGVIWMLMAMMRPASNDTSKDSRTVNGSVLPHNCGTRPESDTSSIVQER